MVFSQEEMRTQFETHGRNVNTKLMLKLGTHFETHVRNVNTI
jgi:hypothetical protein